MSNYTCDNFNTNLFRKSTNKTKNINNKVYSTYKTKKAKRFTPEPDIYFELTSSSSKAKTLNQLIFWSNKSTILTDGWFYKKYEEWEAELHISERTLRTIFKEFEKAGWIKTKIKKVFGIPTKHFKVNLENIIESIKANPNIESIKKNTSEDKSSDDGSGNHDHSVPAILPEPYIDTYNDKDYKDRGNRSRSNYEDYDAYCEMKSSKTKRDSRKDNCPTTKSDYYHKQTVHNQDKLALKDKPIEEVAKECKEICRNDEDCKKLFDQKLGKYEVTYDEVLEQCYEYNLFEKRKPIYPSLFKRWIETQDPAKQKYRKKQAKFVNNFTEKERDLISLRKQELRNPKYQGLLTKEKRIKADELIAKMKNGNEKL